MAAPTFSTAPTLTAALRPRGPVRVPQYRHAWLFYGLLMLVECLPPRPRQRLSGRVVARWRVWAGA